MFTLYDTQLYQYYVSGGKWSANPKRFWDQCGFKNMLNTYMHYHSGYSKRDLHLKTFVSGNPTQRVLNTVKLIPERFIVRELKDGKLIDLFHPYEWYKSTLKDK
jgi:hypothetical protein